METFSAAIPGKIKDAFHKYWLSSYEGNQLFHFHTVNYFTLLDNLQQHYTLQIYLHGKSPKWMNKDDANITFFQKLSEVFFPNLEKKSFYFSRSKVIFIHVSGCFP